MEAKFVHFGTPPETSERWVAVLKLFSCNKKRCSERREKRHKCVSEELLLGIILQEKKKKKVNSKFPSIGKASINHRIRPIGSKSSLTPELRELVIVQFV